LSESSEPVLPFNTSLGGAELNGILQNGSTFSRQHSLVDNGGALDQKHIACNTTILLSHHSGLQPTCSLCIPRCHDSALKDDEHEKGEERVIPVFIKHPEADTENLEDEEGGDSMLLEQFCERRNGDVEGISAIVLLETGDFFCGGETL
ncbi:hypothetical protein KCU73_g154, partial [Aureobasidium melanogenum]